MRPMLSATREVLGLFIDDAGLALALVIWCIGASLGLPHLVPSYSLQAPILFVGCLVILFVSVGIAVRRHQPR